MANEFKVKNGLIVIGDLSTSGTITINGALAATQSWVASQGYLTSASLSGYATQSYVTSAIAALIDSAPAALDTLNELAAALGDDANFSTTITNSIASKQSQLNGTGLVRMSGTSVSYDNTTYLISNFGNIEGDHTYGYPSSEGWYKIAEVVLTSTCQSFNLWGEYRDTGYFDNSHYRIHITARAECDFPSNNESHAINVNIYGSSTNDTYFSNNVRVVLTQSSSNYRKYELQYYRSTWDTGSWRLQTLGWTTYTTSQTAGTPTGTPRVYYVSKFSTDNIFVANKISIGTTYAGFAANIAGTTYIIGASAWVNDGYGITNASSPGTGFFPYSDGNSVINSNNTTRLFVNGSTGNIGIGTSSPAYKLDVNGTIRTQTGYILGANTQADIILDGSTGSQLRYGTQKVTLNSSNVSIFTADVNRLFVTNAGDVGIGTTNPSVKLDIIGSIRSEIGSDGNFVTLQATGQRVHYIKRSGQILQFTSDGANTYDVQFDSYNRSVYFATGNVGIGTTSPGATLDVAGALNNGRSIIRVTNTDTSNYITIGAGIPGISNAGMNFTLDGTSKMVIDASGKVGIGITNPSYKLQVDGNIASTNSTGAGLFAISGTRSIAVQSFSGDWNYIRSNNANLVFGTQDNANLYIRTNDTDRIFVNTSGKVAIGTTDTNSDKSDFTVYTGSGASIALTDDQVRMGGADVNWGVALRSYGALQTYGQALTLNTQAGNYAVNVQPNGTTVAQFYQDYSYFPGLDFSISRINAAHASNYFRGDASHLVIGTSGTLYLNYGGNTTNITGTTYINGNLVWHAGNDGTGSTLDADLLDGNHASYFINTSNIGSQSVSYANTAGALSSMNISQFNNNSGYVAYGNYSWTSPVFGQYGIKSNLIDNILYSAADRFEVFRDGSPWNTNAPFNLNYDQSVDVIPSNTSRTYSIVFNTKGNPSYGIVYPWGKIYLSFYYINIPASITGRTRDQNGVWSNLSGWTNVANSGSYAVWSADINGSNYLVELEITINAGSSVNTWFAQWEYVMGRPGQYELGIISKAQDNSLWRNMYFRDSSNNVQVSIGASGLSTSQNLNITGSVGLNFSSYGGGFYMQDSSWIRTVNYKSIWTQTGLLGTDGGLTVGYGGTTPPSGGAIISGNVGIGATSLEAKLHVVSGASQAGILSRGVSGDTWFPYSNGQNYVRGVTNFDLGSVYFTGGNIGIGTNSPASLLHVYNNADVWHTRIGGASGELRIGGQTSSGAVIQAYTPGGSVRDLYLQRDGGNVGIGTTTAADPLHIVTSGNDKFIRIENSNSYTGLWLNDGGTNSGWLVLSGYTNISSPGDFSIREYGVQTSLTIKQTTGNVGIGTTTPQKKLDVFGSAGIIASIGAGISVGQFAGFHFGYSETIYNNDSYKKSALVFERTDNNGQGSNASGKIHFLLNNLSGNSANSLNDSVVTIDSDASGTVGSVRMGIGTRNPLYPLDVNGTSRFSQLAYFDAYESMNVYGVRGRFTNEFIHLYNKVGVGSPNGWGQGEVNTPVYGFSTYGGINIAYGYDGSAYINTYTRINKNWAGGDFGAEQFTIRGTYPSIALRNTQADNKWLFNSDGYGDLRFYQGSTVDNNAWTNQITFNRSGQIDASGGNSSQWNTAYGWGNHASAGYLTSSSLSGYATTSYVTTQINNLINGAPGALDTLNELASALGNDASFATTVTNSIAGKVSKSGDTMTGTLTLNAGLNAYASPIYVNEIRFRDTAGSPASDPYSMRWVSESSARGAGLSWLEFQLNDDDNEEIRIYGNSCAGYGCGAVSENLYHRFRADGYAWHAGNLSIGGTLTESSSLKLKENIKTSEGNLEKVVNLRPVTYNKIGSETKELGLIAEEVAEVYPEFVKYDENGDPIGVNYSRLTAALIGAVKELTKRIETLENNG